MTTSRSASAEPSDPNDPLAQFLADPEHRRLSTAEYVSQGVEQVTERHLEQLMPQLSVLRARIQQIKDSPRLQARLESLAQFLEDTATGADAGLPARREAAFALAYFLHGTDRIPDATPRYGLLDDALVVEAVLTRNDAAMRAQAQRSGRAWPEEL